MEKMPLKIIGYTIQDIWNLQLLTKQIYKILFSGFRGTEQLFKQNSIKAKRLKYKKVQFPEKE